MEKKLAVIVDNNEEITTGNDGTEMCSSGADVAVEMCSPESHDTCRDCVFAFQTLRKQRRWDVDKHPIFLF
ncbi:MAG TPA: hypothetical protein H9696_09350, partial [Candidatus Anaerostipes avicola]|uniref:hypothetical protein n=1 Tax=Anaerostipes butyraticus TaxID=645466 RepID=UPI001F92147D|nr:hypothetical protein [Candidatus Anaerostipes avicola]